MLNTEDIVFKERIIYVVDRDENLIRGLDPLCIDRFRVSDIGPQDSGYVFLQNVVACLLQIGVQGQVQ